MPAKTSAKSALSLDHIGTPCIVPREERTLAKAKKSARKRATFGLIVPPYGVAIEDVLLVGDLREMRQVERRARRWLKVNARQVATVKRSLAVLVKSIARLR